MKGSVAFGAEKTRRGYFPSISIEIDGELFDFQCDKGFKTEEEVRRFSFVCHDILTESKGRTETRVSPPGTTFSGPDRQEKLKDYIKDVTEKVEEESFEGNSKYE